MYVSHRPPLIPENITLFKFKHHSLLACKLLMLLLRNCEEPVAFKLERLIQNPVEGNAWHADHILAVADAGEEFILENFRTLCIACYAKMTAEQHGQLTSKMLQLKKSLQRTIKKFQNHTASMKRKWTIDIKIAGPTFLLVSFQTLNHSKFGDGYFKILRICQSSLSEGSVMETLCGSGQPPTSNGISTEKFGISTLISRADVASFRNFPTI